MTHLMLKTPSMVCFDLSWSEIMGLGVDRFVELCRMKSELMAAQKK